MAGLSISGKEFQQRRKEREAALKAASAAPGLAKGKKRKYIHAIKGQPEAFDPKTKKWETSREIPTRMKGLWKERIIKPPIVYGRPGDNRLVTQKIILSKRTKKPVKRIGPRTKVAFKYVYRDGSVYQTKYKRPSKAEIKVFKAQPIYSEKTETDTGDPRELTPAEGTAQLIFTKSLEIVKGGPVKSVRQALGLLLGRFVIPKEGVYEIVVDWKIYEDFDKNFIMDAPPSKRFVIDARGMHLGYKNFLASIWDLKKADLADELGIDEAEVTEDPEFWRERKAELLKAGDVPRNSTRAFIEKQILTLAQGRGIYISDQSYFKDYHKAGKQKPKTATVSALTIAVYERG